MVKEVVKVELETPVVQADNALNTTENNIINEEDNVAIEIASKKQTSMM
jgi:hypothetical protein